ncbi:MAG: rRNA maturation RNase YbeY [Xanthobacteraceae bacterium]|jgi:probable rRNA maturation factor
MKRTAAAGLKIDVLVDSEHWKNAGTAKAVVRRALKQAATALSTKSAELAIVLTDDAAMRRLNRNWRGVDAPTNVLSFATKNPGNRHMRDRVSDELDKRLGKHLGDIVLAYETVKREARREGKPFDHHLAHLAVHGFLHLLGYDHASSAQARRMETIERAVLRDLAVPDPYRANHSTAGHGGRRPAKRPGRDRARAVQNA